MLKEFVESNGYMIVGGYIGLAVTMFIVHKIDNMKAKKKVINEIKERIGTNKKEMYLLIKDSENNRKKESIERICSLMEENNEYEWELFSLRIS